MRDCLFCGIAGKSIPATIVHETETTLAFRDKFPRAPVHVLVIPKEHVESVLALDQRHATLLADIMRTLQTVAKLEKVDARGFRVVANVGPDAGQSVAHLHFHLMAGRTLAWPPG